MNPVSVEVSFILFGPRATYRRGQQQQSRPNYEGKPLRGMQPLNSSRDSSLHFIFFSHTFSSSSSFEKLKRDARPKRIPRNSYPYWTRAREHSISCFLILVGLRYRISTGCESRKNALNVWRSFPCYESRPKINKKVFVMKDNCSGLIVWHVAYTIRINSSFR